MVKKIEWKMIDGVEWCFDSDNNRNSVKYHGSKEAAQKALESLKNCKECENCSDCRSCSYCSGCSDCRSCSYCSDCRECRSCSDCSSKKGVSEDRFTIPKIKNIHQKVFEAALRENALDMGKWQTCKTTHCRAGWVIFLAGEEGKKLESIFGSALAASMIYRDSSEIKVGMTDFFKTNAETLESMRKAAEKEKLTTPSH